jgi:hypothetical protein
MGRHAAEDERSTQPAKAGAPSSYFSDGARTNRRPGVAGNSDREIDSLLPD